MTGTEQNEARREAVRREPSGVVHPGPAGDGKLRMLVIGEEHVRSKAARHYALLREKGVEASFYVDDRSGITRSSEADIDLRVRYGPNPRGGILALLAYWRSFASELRTMRPHVVEVYTSIHPAVLLPMVTFARALGISVVVVCRGEIHPERLARIGRTWRMPFWAILRSANLVIYKELYMAEVLARHVPGVPVFAWNNAVPPGPEPEYGRAADHVLYLNFFRRPRNLELIVRAAERVLREVPGAEFHLVGGARELAERSDFYADLNDYEEEIRSLIRELALEDRVHIHPFTADVQAHFASAKVYLLPADRVFCNYALLEAMAAGIPPIVSADVDPGARLIVEDGVSGYVVEREPQRVADAITRLLRDEALRQELGRGARRTIEERFDLFRTAEALVEQYRALAAGARAA